MVVEGGKENQKRKGLALLVGPVKKKGIHIWENWQEPMGSYNGLGGDVFEVDRKQKLPPNGGCPITGEAKKRLFLSLRNLLKPRSHE